MPEATQSTELWGIHLASRCLQPPPLRSVSSRSLRPVSAIWGWSRNIFLPCVYGQKLLSTLCRQFSTSENSWMARHNCLPLLRRRLFQLRSGPGTGLGRVRHLVTMMLNILIFRKQARRASSTGNTTFEYLYRGWKSSSELIHHRQELV